MAQDLTQLQERRVKLQEQIDEIDNKILEHKRVRRDELLAELKELGFDGKPGKKSVAAVITRAKKDEPCKICGYKTNPLHDSRKHRSQGDSKKAFTPKELDELGLKKLS